MDFASLASSEFALMAFDLDRDGLTDLTAGVFSDAVHDPNPGVVYSLAAGFSLPTLHGCYHVIRITSTVFSIPTKYLPGARGYEETSSGAFRAE